MERRIWVVGEESSVVGCKVPPASLSVRSRNVSLGAICGFVGGGGSGLLIGASTPDCWMFFQVSSVTLSNQLLLCGPLFQGPLSSLLL